jgi:hypothetical protein
MKAHPLRKRKRQYAAVRAVAMIEGRKLLAGGKRLF